MYKTLSFIIVSLFGCGKSPIASGTVGSFATLPLAYFLIQWYGIGGIIAGAFVLFFLGVLFSVEVLKYTAHDPAIIVIDEAVGQLLSFLFVAESLKNSAEQIGISGQVCIYLAAFFLFRFFDIVKPQPAKFFDKCVLNAWGVMLDDVAAGLYAAVVVYCIYALWY